VLAFAIDAATRVCLFLLICAVMIAPLEWAATRRGPPLRAALPALGLLAISTVLALAVARGLAQAWPAMFDLRTRAAPDWPRLGLSLLLTDVLGYALHRASHASPLLWRFHRVHHAPSRLWWLEAWRQHPVDAALHLLVATAPAVLLQVPLVAHAPVLLLRRVYTSLLHADLPWPRSPLDRVLATPCFHHRHHHPHAPAANFAGTLAVLDVLFGTWSDVDRPHDRRPVLRGAGEAAQVGEDPRLATAVRVPAQDRHPRAPVGTHRVAEHVADRLAAEER